MVGSWFVVSSPRWALVTIGASATLMLLSVVSSVLQVSTSISSALTIACLLGHLGSLTLTLDTSPKLSVGDPPGRMLSSFAIQSPSHAVRYRVPFPTKPGERMRVKMVLAQPYDGPIPLHVDISGRLSGSMRPMGENTSEREFVFGSDLFRDVESVTVTITQDNYDPNLRIAYWKSDLGRTIPGEAEYISEYGVIRGIPDPLTGRVTRGWPLIWIQTV